MTLPIVLPTQPPITGARAAPRAGDSGEIRCWEAHCVRAANRFDMSRAIWCRPPFIERVKPGLSASSSHDLPATSPASCEYTSAANGAASSGEPVRARSSKSTWVERCAGVDDAGQQREPARRPVVAAYRVTGEVVEQFMQTGCRQRDMLGIGQARGRDRGLSPHRLPMEPPRMASRAVKGGQGRSLTSHRVRHM